jgi:antitoxin FitA
MTSLTIRNVDDVTKQRLRVQAALHGVSMEEEVRRILKKELMRPAAAQSGLGRHLQNHFAGLASEAFDLPQRQAPRCAPELDEPT